MSSCLPLIRLNYLSFGISADIAPFSPLSLLLMTPAAEHFQSVGINQKAPIREGTEFIISCVAHGSPQIAFRWFKDGVFINTTRSNRLVVSTQQHRMPQ